jgi:hypothetical protein
LRLLHWLFSSSYPDHSFKISLQHSSTLSYNHST